MIGADSGKWRSSSCSQTLPTACRAADPETSKGGRWVLGSGSKGECPAGTAFELPQNAKENEALWDLLKQSGAATAWLPLQGEALLDAF